MPKMTSAHGSGTRGSRRSAGSRSGFGPSDPNSRMSAPTAAGVSTAATPVEVPVPESVPTGPSSVDADDSASVDADDSASVDADEPASVDADEPASVDDAVTSQRPRA